MAQQIVMVEWYVDIDGQAAQTLQLLGRSDIWLRDAGYKTDSRYQPILKAYNPSTNMKISIVISTLFALLVGSVNAQSGSDSSGG